LSLADLPVDNRYKFAALSGVALAGFLLWLSWKTLRELQATLLALAIKTARIAGAQTQHEDPQKFDDVMPPRQARRSDSTHSRVRQRPRIVEGYFVARNVWRSTSLPAR
jgi:hypothetical protein